MTTSDGGSDDSATTVATPAPGPESAVAAALPEPEPEPAFVVVSRDEVEEYASKGYQPGYAMLKPA